VSRDEIAESLIARVCAISDPREAGPEYVVGLREAVAAALDYGLAAIAGRAPTGPVPVVLVEQARAAARNGVSLDTVLRRYLAGYTLLCDHLLSEAERDGGAKDHDLRRALRAQSAQLDRLLAVVTQAYMAEVADRHGTTDRRRAEMVRQLLDGDLVDVSDLGYELDGWHLGVVAAGPSAPKAIRELAALLERSLLLALPGGETAWAWLGGRHPISAKDIRESSIPSLDRGHSITMAIGEVGEGLDGLRLTHRQAKAAFPIARRAKGGLLRYSDVAIVASAWEDDILSKSLTEMFLAPLASERDGGGSLLKTLQAYFAAGRNAASAASALGLSRQTVNSRLRAIEEKIGRPLDGCGAELETALRLWELGHPTALAWSRGDEGQARLSHSRRM
jgi:PucR C-terminal helix-turn-helix domain/GGDEF-like domain